MSKPIRIKGAKVFNGTQWSAPMDTYWLNGVQSDHADSAAQVISAEGCWLLPAMTALSVDFQEPVRDDVYTLRDGFEAMRRGGFYRALTESAANPIDDIQKLKAVQEACRGIGLDIHHLGAISANYEHKSLSEMLELALGGVVGFGDGGDMPSSLRFLRRAMEYGSMSNKRFFIQPSEHSLAGKGVVHEGDPADSLGMKGIPRVAETIAVHQILELAAWLNVAVHLKQLTCAESLELVRAARQRGVDVTCDVSIYHLILDQHCLSNLDPNTYILPPLRSSSDRESLWNALDSGLVDAISCAHIPVLLQDKLVNFEDAVPGAISLEIAFAALCPLADKKLKNGVADLIQLLTHGPMRIMGISPESSVKNWFLYDPNRPMTVVSSVFAGQVCNSPLMGQTLQGTIVGAMFEGVWRSNPWSI